MVYYVDIDETICIYEGDRNYPDAIPIRENIKKINNLYDEGHTIVYWTARGSVTKIDWRDLTKRQLDNWGAKHTELRLGKPHYDLFICDKAINTEDFFNGQD
jgi:hypothetical protein